MSNSEPRTSVLDDGLSKSAAIALVGGVDRQTEELLDLVGSTQDAHDKHGILSPAQVEKIKRTNAMLGVVASDKTFESAGRVTADALEAMINLLEGTKPDGSTQTNNHRLLIEAIQKALFIARNSDLY